MAGSFVNLFVDAYFLTFCTYALGIEAGWMASLFLTARLFDAVNDPIERSKLSRARSIGGTIVGLTALTMVPVFCFDAESNIMPERFTLLAIIFSVLCIISYVILCNCTLERVHFEEKEGEKFEFKKVLGAVLKNRPLIGVMFATIGSMYSMYTFSRKIESTIASSGVAACLGLIGYVSGVNVVQSEATVTGIYYLANIFEEYLWAQGDTVTYEAIKDAFEKRKPLGDAVHRKIMKTFRTYMAVGGMPQAVDAFVNGKTFAQIDFIKRNILSLYEEDLAKYDTENREKASIIYKTIPEQLENKNSHFKFSLVDKNARYQNYIDAVSFVAESMIGNECINVTKPEVALELFSDRSNFKLYMGDIGLLVTQIMKNRDDTDEDLYKALIIDDLGINQCMILENMVAQMLKASGHGLYFHEYLYQPKGNEREKKYEIDFITVKKKKICPIEVKSSNYKSHKSFDYLVQKYQLKMQDRYIIYTKDLKYEDGIMYIPVYMTMFL